MVAKRYFNHGASGLLTLLAATSGFLSLVGAEAIVNNMNHVGVTNVALIKLLGLLKVSGAIALWTPYRDWAQKGFVFLFIGALTAHFGAGDALPAFGGALIGLSLTTLTIGLDRESEIRPASAALQRVSA